MMLLSSLLSMASVHLATTKENELASSSSSWLQPYWNALSADPVHIVIELSCVLVILYLLHRKPYDPRETERLSADEEEELIKAWRPTPLAASSSSSSSSPLLALRRPLAVSAYEQQHVLVNGKRYCNFAAVNFLGIAGNKEIAVKCRATIDRYGVGSCGPRGFYGTFDIHLEIERVICDFFHAPACILYSDSIALMSSVIPAFSKRGDLIVCDEFVSFSIQQGIRLSRSSVLYYKHNDMQDLERLLSQIHEKDMNTGKRAKLNRRFIVCEGISLHHGDIAPLAAIVRLKHKYKYRLIMDDSLALGVLGATGRGTLEHFHLGLDACEVFCAALDTSIASVGGFCVGTAQVVEHQRLSGAGYCFSASSPPYTGTAAIEGLRLLDENPSWCEQVRVKATALRQALSSIPQLVLVGKNDALNSVSPYLHLRIAPSFSSGEREQDELTLLRIKQALQEKDSIIVNVPQYIASERQIPAPSLNIAVTLQHEEQDVQRLAAAITRVAAELLVEAK